MRYRVLALLLAGCPDFAAGPRITPIVPCGASCAPDEACAAAPEADGGFECMHVCANQLHCWSGCCLRTGDAGAATCRPAQACYGDDGGTR